MHDVSYHTLPDGRRMAYRHIPGTGPLLVFLPGYMSDMTGSKAEALMGRALVEGRACLLLDYSGCGASDGDFADGTLSRWRDEVLALIEAVTAGPVMLVGSSMGGWLMLLVGEALGDRLAGMIGIAAAPDFTHWGFTLPEQGRLAAGETIYADNPYGPDPTPTHARFWADGQAQRRLDTPIAVTCPVTLLHGQRDANVPWSVSLRLAAALRSDAVQVVLVKDGDHRLSREEDIALLHQTVAAMFARIAGDAA